MDKQNIAKELADVINIIASMNFKGSDCPNVVNIYNVLGRAIKELSEEQEKGSD